MSGLKINIGILEMDWNPQMQDRQAAWELYVELLTRVTTQYLHPEQGDEAAALKSVHELFALTREILKRHGSECQEFAKLAIVVLNQVIRPFTARWHKLSLAKAFEDTEKCLKFRADLELLQGRLRVYTRMLGDMAGVEARLAELEFEDEEETGEGAAV